MNVRDDNPKLLTDSLAYQALSSVGGSPYPLALSSPISGPSSPQAPGSFSCIADLLIKAPPSLKEQVLESFDPKVTEARWRCRALGNLQALCNGLHIRMTDENFTLYQVFDMIPPNWKPQVVQRLRAVYMRRLVPLIEEHFLPHEAYCLSHGLKSLMLLQALEVPYRVYDPWVSPQTLTELLDRLSLLSKGYGVMAWDEGGARSFLVEELPSRFVAWVLQRMAAILGRDARDKMTADAVWSMLFSDPDGGMRPSRWDPLPPGGELLLDGRCFPGRQAVRIQVDRGQPWVLVFESPWAEDRGRRLQGALRGLPPGISSERVVVWEPRSLSRDETLGLGRYMAVQAALRYALVQHGEGMRSSWLVAALRKRYVIAVGPALDSIKRCYLEGRVVSDGGVYRPDRGAADLVAALGGLCRGVTEGLLGSPEFSLGVY